MPNSTNVYIGRDVPNNKANTFKTPDGYKNVSNTHALIFQNDKGDLIIKDLGSNNGTFVNNIQIIESPICANDIITLGGKNGEGYRLPLNKLISSKFKLNDKEFDERMNRLKDIYFEYTTKSDKLESSREYSQIFRTVPFCLGFLYKLTPITPPNTPFYCDPWAIALIILVIISFIIVNVLITKYSRSSRKKQKELKEEFQIRYICPDCRTRLEPYSWAFIESTKESPCCKRPFNLKD